MSIVKGSNHNPLAIDLLEEGGVLGAMDKPTREAIKAMEERVADWKAFKNTREGAICERLARPHIEAIDSMMNTPSLVNSYPSVDAYHLHMADLRGQRRVWDTIMKYPSVLEKRLNKISGKA